MQPLLKVEAEPASPRPAPRTAPDLSRAGDDSTHRAPRRPAAARVGQWVALAIVFALVLEVTCRVEDWVRYRTPLLSRITSQDDLVVRDADGAHGRPNARFQKWTMNNVGMRGPDVPAVKAPGTVRVVTVGASETFGLYESPDHEYPRQLEDTLRARVQALGCPRVARVEVLNAAMPGMSLPTTEQDVRTRVARLDPDVVVIYPSPAGFLDATPPVATRVGRSRRAAALPRSAALAPRIAKRLRDQVKLLLPAPLATWLRRREAAAAVARYPAGWRYTDVPPDRLASYDAELRRVVGAVRATGAQPVLATHGNMFMQPGPRDDAVLSSWERFYPRASGETIIAFDSAARLVTMQVARDSATAIADVAARLGEGSGELFADFVHFTDAGAALVAGSLGAAVVQASPRLRSCGHPGAATSSPAMSSPATSAAGDRSR